ncbi:MAG: hypothetical protein ACE5H9_18395 [Anaerolineae bacterium]
MARYVKPTLNTKFHIDFRWWQESGRDLGVYLRHHLCPECPPEYVENARGRRIDWISQDTGEVFSLDALWDLIRTHCSQHPNYTSGQTSLVASIFRLFIANDNQPLTPHEIHQHLHKKSPETILRTLGGRQVYMGIRPVTYPQIRKQKMAA